ncbi:MAG: MlaE family lipid ABC transporter permease subunit [Campylobacterales bacterium]|nr:MlaE family lipid ABC transporter permease subunit [Campylobacterales bacterium]
MDNLLRIETNNGINSLNFFGELTLYTITQYDKTLTTHSFEQENKKFVFDLNGLSFLDTAGALFLEEKITHYKSLGFMCTIDTDKEQFLQTLALVQKWSNREESFPKPVQPSFLERVGELFVSYYVGFMGFMSFFGQLVFTKMHYLKSLKNIRYKEIAFEINEGSIKALGIISLTSFLIGLVVAYQSAYQLKIYGANIFIVDMLGLSILRELAPLMTAIVIAGRSGSAFTAQIGAMKITQELDAMRTMGFDPYIFLVMPRIIALMLMMPILIFIADIMGLLGGMIIASIDLNITIDLFLDRFREVIAAKHFFIGLVKGPFFAFLIASIAIYRGLQVKDDTQSIGFNTTKSVVESIFAVIVCDAVFSIIFTNLGI